MSIDNVKVKNKDGTYSSSIPLGADAENIKYFNTNIKDVLELLDTNVNQIITLINEQSHNSRYRGKYLGSQVTTEQYNSIANGTFSDLYIGDYWTINGINWQIAAFDYWLGTGSTRLTTHHIVIVPTNNLLAGSNSAHWINSTNTTTGAYVGSDFYSSYNEETKTVINANGGKAQCVNIINSTFGANHILTRSAYLKNAVKNGFQSGGIFVNSTIELLSEYMVFGSKIHGNIINGTEIPNNVTIDNTQLPLFALNHSSICNGLNWWLRDIVSATKFAYVYSNGNIGHANADYGPPGIRPVFGICA